MSVNATFLREARRSDQALAACVRVYLAEPSTRTLKLSTLGFDTPDGTTWESCITEFDDIVAPGSPLSPGPDLCTAGFKIASRAALGFQADGDNVTNLFADFRWYGAPVEIFIWPFRSTDATDLTRVFAGVVGSYKIGPDVCEVHLIQRSDWDRQISPVIVTRDKYPRAPDRSVGLPLGIAYGRVALPMRAPWPSQSSFTANMEQACGGRLGVPAVCIDTGRGGAGSRQKFLIASHPIKNHDQSAGIGLSYFMDQDDHLSIVLPSALINGPGGAGFELADAFTDAHVAIRPTDVYAGGINPRYALDADESIYAQADASNPSASQTLQFYFGAGPTDPGTLAQAWLVMGYQASSVGGTMSVSVGSGGTPTSSSLSSGGPQAIRMSLGTAWDGNALPAIAWAFEYTHATVTVSNTPGIFVKVFFLGVEVKFQPKAHIWSTATKPRVRLAEVIRTSTVPGVMSPKLVSSAPDTEVEAQFYGTVEGYADDGSGTFTGTAGALIESPPDIMNHILRTYGGQSAGQIETAPGVHGSFTDARSLSSSSDDAIARTPIPEVLAVAIHEAGHAAGAVGAGFGYRIELVSIRPEVGVSHGRTNLSQQSATPGPREVGLLGWVGTGLEATCAAMAEVLAAIPIDQESRKIDYARTRWAIELARATGAGVDEASVTRAIEAVEAEARRFLKANWTRVLDVAFELVRRGEITGGHARQLLADVEPAHLEDVLVKLGIG